MEGGVFEDERIGTIGNKRGRGDEKQDEKMGRLEKRPSGIVVMDEYSYSGDEMINGVKYEEEKTSTPTSASTTPSGGGGGGLFNQLITNLVNSPKSDGSKCGHGGEVGGDEVVKKDDGVVEENGGGLEDNNKDNAGGGESIIDNIVAKLPRTLSEDTGTVPEPDEASILLHSIIHD